MKQVDFARERRWWNAKAPKEEQEMFDEAVNRALRWRVIDKNLDGIKTIFDVGAGTGIFSIPLSKRGFQVTHLDFSPAMLDAARKKSAELANITFVEANAVDLSRFQDRSFDLVLNTDGAISFCGSEAEQALRESCRVTGKKLIVTVTNRICTIPS
ncbi:class I SAM-dependent methyltransferase [candidate division WOR-3 bacterium]|nr:class I SAM-dependent methyltransferase [candidate division WOR-3 bacterium]